MPINELPFKSIVVASDNDPYVSLQRSEYFSNSWKSTFINYGSNGHINSDSKLLSWEFGKKLVKQLSSEVK